MSSARKLETTENVSSRESGPMESIPWGPGFLHHYFHSESVTDLQAMMTEAERRLVDRRASQESCIHLHGRGEGEIKCHLYRDSNHLYYQFERFE